MSKQAVGRPVRQKRGVPTMIRFEPDLLTAVDHAAADEVRSRANMCSVLIREALERRAALAGDQTAGSLAQHPA